MVYPSWPIPTYDVGARLAGRPGGARGLADPARPAAARAGLAQLAEQSDRAGAAASITCARWCGWARERGAVVASDECYLGLGWDAQPVSVLHPSVCDGDHTGLLAVHSLSKRSIAGRLPGRLRRRRPALVAELLAVRKHAGMMVPTPVQAAMVAALDDDAHAASSATRYARRGAALLPALQSAGLGDRPLRGRAVPVGDPRRAVPRHRRGGWRSAASWWRPASSTARRRAARPGGADRHRRAHRRRRRPAGRPVLALNTPRSGPGQPSVTVFELAAGGYQQTAQVAGGRSWTTRQPFPVRIAPAGLVRGLRP